jgi:phage terminase large subunit-like protein
MSAAKGIARSRLRARPDTGLDGRNPNAIAVTYDDTGKNDAPVRNASEGAAALYSEGIALNAAALRSVATIFTNTPGANVDATDLVAAVAHEARQVEDGNLAHLEGMLASQAITLNALFATYIHKAVEKTGTPAFDAYMRIAMRAQAQGRATVETLVYAKNPPSAVFAKQANIANGPQQINNGSRPEVEHLGPVRPASARARLTEVQPSKLLEAGVSGEQRKRLDEEAKGAPVKSDSRLATVEVLNRSQIRGGKVPRIAQRVQGRGSTKVTRGAAKSHPLLKGAR